MQVNTIIEFEVTFKQNLESSNALFGLVDRCAGLFVQDGDNRARHEKVEVSGRTAAGKIEAWREISTTEPVAPVREDIANEVVPELHDVLSSLPYVIDVTIGSVELTDADIN